jgi:hypothetical protein
MNTKKLILPVALIILLIGALLFVSVRDEETLKITTFEECAELYPILETYPEQCNTPDGKHFVREIVNKYSDLIQLDEPISGAVVSSPLTITGRARGNWYFEASFPVRLEDANGKVLVQSFAQAQSEWMTTDFVSFKAELVFSKSETDTGFLILKNDNPSGLPENDKQIKIPIFFDK